MGMQWAGNGWGLTVYVMDGWPVCFDATTQAQKRGNNHALKTLS